MPYTVHAHPQIPKGTAVQAAHQTRKDAIRAAVALVAEGIQGVTITDEDRPERFGRTMVRILQKASPRVNPSATATQNSTNRR